MRSMLACGILALALVAACSTAEPAGTWLYGPEFSPPAASEAASAAASPSATQGAASPGASAGGSGITIGTDTATELQFDPETASVAGGGTVEIVFENRSTLPHNLTFQAGIDAATEPVVDPGASETLTFEAPAPGDYPFVCTLHPGMDGTLTIEGP